MNKKCERCNKKLATHNHAKDRNHKNWDEENREYLCTLCHAKEHGIEPKYSELRELVTYYEKYQRTKDMIKNTTEALTNIELVIPNDLTETQEKLEQKEKEYRKKIEQYFKENPSSIHKWLVSLRGVSDVLAGKVLSRILGREFPRGEASLWHHGGVIPGCIKKKGEKANWDGDLHRYLVGDYHVAHEFTLHKTPKYYEIYQREKLKQKKNGLVDKKTGKTNKHAERVARRKVAKVFLRDLYNRLEK